MSPTPRDPQPVAAPPVRPPSKAPARAAAPVPRTPEPTTTEPRTPEPATAPQPSRQVEQRPSTDTEGLLASVMPEQENASASYTPGQPRTTYGAFMGITRTVDPEKDLAPSAPRLPRYVLAAVTLIRNVTGRSQQAIIAEALTGKTPIPAEILDAAFIELYGYPRPPA